MAFDRALRAVARCLHRVAHKRGEALLYSRKSGAAVTVYGFIEPSPLQGAPVADVFAEVSEAVFVVPRQTGLVDPPQVGDTFAAKGCCYVVDGFEEYGPGAFTGDSGTTSGSVATGATGLTVTGRVVPWTGATFLLSGNTTLHTVTEVTRVTGAWTLAFTPATGDGFATACAVQWRNVRSAAAWRIRAQREPSAEKVGV